MKSLESTEVYVKNPRHTTNETKCAVLLHPTPLSLAEPSP